MIEDGGDKLFNTTVVFDPDGREVARYRKIHLFDITGPDGTGYRESALYGAGDELVRVYQAVDRVCGELIDAARERHEVAWHWVKGHASDPLNNRVDALAVAAMVPFKRR